MKMKALLVLLVFAALFSGISSETMYWNGERFHRIVNGTVATLEYIESQENNTSKTLIGDGCKKELREFATGLYKGEEWAWRMADSWGAQPSGIFLGDFVWEGKHEACTRVPDKEPKKTGHHCIVKHGLGPTDEEDGFGACVPKACDIEDVKMLLSYGKKSGHLMNELPWLFPSEPTYFYGSYCITPLSEREFDGKAIAMIVILSIFAILAVAGSIYDIVLQWRKCKCRSGGCGSNSADKTQNPINLTKFEATRNGEAVPDKPEAAENGVSNGGMEIETQGNGEVKTAATEQVQMESTNSLAQIQPSESASQSDKVSARDVCSELVLAFSFYRHIQKILSFDHSKGSLKCVHGVRALSFAWIVLGHNWTLGLSLTEVSTAANPDYYGQARKQGNYMIIDRMNYAVEAFFILSGMLVTMSLLRKLEKGKFTCKSVPYYIFHRYIRLSPAYFIVLGFWASLFYYLGSGPLFKESGLREVDGCSLVTWKYLTYINNIAFISPGINCFGWAWYLANDFQFYCFAPIYVVALYKKPIVGKIILGVMIVLNFVIRIPLFLYFANDIGQWFAFIYFPPYSRYATYLLGILLGYHLHQRKFQRLQVHPAVYTVLWCLAMVLISVVVFNSGENWGNIGGSIYRAADRILFGIGVCWILFACLTGTGGIVNTVLSWRGWLPISRLSYLGYIIHPILIYYTYYSSPVQIYLTNNNLLHYFLGNIVLTLFASLFVSACVEMPFIAIENTIKKAIKSKRA